MTDKSFCTGNDPGQDPKPKVNLAGAILSDLWMVPAIAVFIVILFLVVGHVQFNEIGRRFVSAFVYSAFIGTLSIVLVSWITTAYKLRYLRLVVVLQGLVLLCTSTVGSLAADFFLVLSGFFPRGIFWSEFRTSLPFSIVFTLTVGLGIASFETMRDKLQAARLDLGTQQMEQERANKLLAEAKLSSLESRIHPHFLFNTLNSIAALIPTDPKRAEDTVGQLAALLRFSLNANQSGLTPLGQELKIIRDYLEIEKTRFGQRLRYEITVPETMADIKVPPLALQSLVENVVKHVVSVRPQGALIEIAGSRNDGRVRLEVSDDGPGFSLDVITPNHGLGNLIARIELLFGPTGQLEVSRENEKSIVRLSLPA